MAESVRKKNLSILVVDDNGEIHADFQKVLCAEPGATELEDMEAALFGESRAVASPTHKFDVSSAYQGTEAVEKVRNARSAGKPFAVVFVDVRMPPGWDGVETLSRLWREDSGLQAVICTAYSDYSWVDLVAQFGQTDRLLVLKKPFDPIEVRQIATALTEKWNQEAELAAMTRRIRLQNVVMQILMAASSLPQGGVDVLRVLGPSMGARFGSLWVVDAEQSELCCVCIWNGAGQRFADVEKETEASRYPVQRGLLDRLYSGFFSVRVVDEDGADERMRSAARAGSQSVLLFPLRCDGKTIGVFELLHEKADLDEDALASVVELCDSVAHFVNSKQIELALQRSEAKNTALLNAIPDTIYRLRRDGACLDRRVGRNDLRSQRESSIGISTRDLKPRDLPSDRGLDGIAKEVEMRLVELVAQAIESGRVHALEYSAGDGEDLRHFEARVVGSGTDEALVIVRDVTEKKLAAAEKE